MQTREFFGTASVAVNTWIGGCVAFALLIGLSAFQIGGSNQERFLTASNLAAEQPAGELDHCKYILFRDEDESCQYKRPVQLKSVQFPIGITPDASRDGASRG